MGRLDCSKKDNIKCYSLCKAYKDKVGVRGEEKGGNDGRCKSNRFMVETPKNKNYMKYVTKTCGNKHCLNDFILLDK
jgi:hypothetical protein